MNTLLLYIAVGTLAGFVNGLFGTGGGIALVLLFSYLKYPAEKIFATTNFCILLFSAVSFFFYSKIGNFSTAFYPGFLWVVAGGTLGSFFLSKIKGSFLKRLFSALVIIGGVVRLLK